MKSKNLCHTNNDEYCFVVVVDVSREKKSVNTQVHELKNYIEPEFPEIEFFYFQEKDKFWVLPKPYDADFVISLSEMINGYYSNKVNILVGVGTWKR